MPLYYVHTLSVNVPYFSRRKQPHLLAQYYKAGLSVRYELFIQIYRVYNYQAQGRPDDRIWYGET